ncbi:MAG TPA: disulfide bond formation protein B [Caulobacteraceae bacterium]|nr:disulfide bond formation protein B [Caulobacteraceae bacterium]
MTSILRHWPWAALIISLSVLGVAHAFETFGRMAPCELCLKEREVYWLAAALAALGGGLSFTPLKPGRWVSAVLALVFLGGALLAGYHAGVEWKFFKGPASCTGSHVQVSTADLARMLNGGPIGVPACDKPAWVFLGISMAGWNALISLGLAGVSAVAALAPRPTARAS